MTTTEAIEIVKTAQQKALKAAEFFRERPQSSGRFAENWQREADAIAMLIQIAEAKP